MRATVYVAIPLMLLLAVLQTAVLPRFPILGLTPLLPLLVVISWTLLHGLEEGLVWGFTAGLAMDLFSIGPLGATALAYMTAVLAVAGLVRALVVLDVMMPGIGGIEALRRIRAASTVPVLMLTARGDDLDRIVGLELGADDYVPKPCMPRELAARLRAILRRSQKGGELAAQAPLVVGPG